MALVNDTNGGSGYAVTQPDGYITRYNGYYNDDNGTWGTSRPFVLFCHGLGDSRATAEATARTLANQGFICITWDARGQGAGIAENAAPPYGNRFFSALEMNDPFEVLEDAFSRYSAIGDSTKVGVTGTSQGAVYCWIMAALSGRYPVGATKHTRDGRFPVITAIAPVAFSPNVLTAEVPQDDAFSSYAFSIFNADAGLEPHVVLDTALKARISADDPNGYRLILSGGNDTTNSGVDWLFQGTNGSLAPLIRDSGVHILYFADWDDKITTPNQGWQDIVGMSPRPLFHFGSTGSHGATAVATEVALKNSKRLAFFQYHLMGDSSNLASYFDAAAYDDISDVQLAIVPNTAADYILTSGYADTTWSYATKHIATAQHIENLDNPSVNSSAVQLYLADSGVLQTSAPTGSSSTTTITKTWGTATTITDLTTEATTSPNNLADFVEGRSTPDEHTFSIAWGSGDTALYAGIARAKIYAQASEPGAVLYAKLQYHDGTNTVPLADAYYRFPSDYNTDVGAIRELDLEFNMRAMHLPGGASGEEIRLVLSESPHWDPNYTDTNKLMRIHPHFNDYTVTVHHDATYQSWVRLPLNDPATEPITL